MRGGKRPTRRRPIELCAAASCTRCAGRRRRKQLRVILGGIGGRIRPSLECVTLSTQQNSPEKIVDVRWNGRGSAVPAEVRRKDQPLAGTSGARARWDPAPSDRFGGGRGSSAGAEGARVAPSDHAAVGRVVIAVGTRRWWTIACARAEGCAPGDGGRVRADEVEGWVVARRSGRAVVPPRLGRVAGGWAAREVARVGSRVIRGALP